MANKPELKRAVAGSKIKANDYNYNFEQLNNYIENGIADNAINNYEPNREYKKGQWVLAEVEGKSGLYESLVDGNKGNFLTDEAYWKKVSMGGAGLEIGDIGFTQLAIDESLGKRRILNGTTIIQEQYPVVSERIKLSIAQNPNLACTEEEWQNEVSATGFCGKYVVSTDTIRLPKFPEYLIAGLANTVPVIGNGLTLGLTNGQVNVGLVSQHTNGQGYVASYTNIYGQPVGTGASTIAGSTISLGVTTDPTKSGIVAQLDEAGDKICGTYFIQVATGSEYQDNITNEIELNNPFVLLEGKYFEAPVYNVSWLQSNAGFTGSSALHPTAYNALLVEQNPSVEVGTTVDNYTKRGLSVKLDTETYTDYDFVLNTTSRVFRCPLKQKTMDRYLVDVKQATANDPTWYNLYSDGWCEQGGISPTNFPASSAGSDTITLTKTYKDNNYTVIVAKNTTNTAATYGVSYSILSNTQFKLNNNASVGGNISWTTYGYVTETVAESLTDKLYFYVGETVQNANLVNVGRVEEKISNIIPDNSSLISGYCVPDYSALVTRTSGTYTEDYNGVIIVRVTNTSGQSNFAIEIEGSKFSFIQGYSGSDYTHPTNGWFAIPKGVPYTLTMGYQTEAVFCPMRGEI